MEVSQDSPRDRRKRLAAECSARLTAARDALGLSQAECASRLSVARSTWSDWESGVIPDAVRGGQIEDMLGVERGSIYRAEDGAADGPVVVREGFDQTTEVSS